jgi:ectoine utilization protein EutC
MGTVRVLTENELRGVVGLGEAELLAVEAVYPLISAGVGSMPPIMRVEVPESNGEIDIKSAYLPGYSGIAVKVSAGFFDNPSRGMPSLGGLMMVFDSETGVPQAAIFDNGYLTDLRTALAGAVAARHLANPDASTVAVLGAGVQARLQMEVLSLVRPIELVTVWARRADRAVALASELSSRLGLSVETADSPMEAVATADILVTTTPSTEPLVDESMLHPGLHITAVGADAEGKQEVAADAISAADRFFCDSISQSARLGELRAAVSAGFERSAAIELGSVISGESPGRDGREQVTICDLTGTGAQDTAIASLALEKARQAGAGIEIET